MKKVTKYESNDGSLFATEEEAQLKDKIDSFKEWYDENKLYGSSEGCKIEWEDFVEWLMEHKDTIMFFLK